MNDLYKPFAFGDTGTTLEEALKELTAMEAQENDQ